jgi:hypothetical protein
LAIKDTNLSYFELPSKKKQLWVSIGTLIVYGIIFVIADTLFPEISPEVKKKLSQGGLFTIFISGLLASQGYFWASKVQHNKDIAELEIEKYKEHLEILISQQNELPGNFSKPIANNKSKLTIAKAKLIEVNEHPTFILFSGKLSVAILALGTLLCIIGEG